MVPSHRTFVFEVSISHLTSELRLLPILEHIAKLGWTWC